MRRIFLENMVKGSTKKGKLYSFIFYRFEYLTVANKNKIGTNIMVFEDSPPLQNDQKGANR